MKYPIGILLSLSLLMLSCGGLNTKMTGSWTNTELLNTNQYGSVFIEVMGPSPQIKNKLESNLAAEARQRGLKSIEGNKVFKSSFFTSETPSKEQVLEKIRSTGMETIFTVYLKDKETVTRYVPGTTTYAPAGFGYYRNYYGYYTNFYQVAQQPGYYQNTNVYYVESNLYDVKNEELLWSAQSKTYNPQSAENFVEGYTQAVINQLLKDGVLQKDKVDK
ncbi:hypothetical protein [Aquimarina brevivitae]|uniref:DUF4136 domain-containing protein n=1 Tax=Aquimarina brevivitae TaxID=323412 RepID=A0A4Q7NXD1_9FLAO|nr:hypothetical protein [Aquimarina brevivitae]RZS91877.1 hypothetical protein EV197_2980 [Aquimarina brevivitae]